MNSKKIIKNFKDIKFPITKDEFISMYNKTKNNRLYNVKYDFSELPETINSKDEKFTLICLEKLPNGEIIGKCKTSFYQFIQLERDVNKYLKNRKEISQEEFIKRSKTYYGDDTFGYDKLEYSGWNSEIILKCNKCGNYFTTTPRLHLLGSKGTKKNKFVVGCNNCNKEFSKTYNIDLINQGENWIIKAKNKYGKDLFDYSEVVFMGNELPVKILCKKCGNYFWQTPRGHLRSSNDCCPSCTAKRLGRECSNSTSKFIKNCIKIHGKERYDFSKVKYKTLVYPVRIIDKINNVDFLITPKSFLQGVNYETKGKSVGEEFIITWISLNRNKIKFNREINLNINKFKVRIDYIINFETATYWIEYNGKQHYDPDSMIRILGGNSNTGIKGKLEESQTHTRYIRQVERDKAVRKYCEENGIIFIEIPYTYRTYKSIAEVLDRIIFEGENPDDVIKRIYPKPIE